MIVLNSLNDTGAGFGHDTNKITIFQKDGGELRFETKSKDEVAKDIVDTIINSLLCLKETAFLFFMHYRWDSACTGPGNTGQVYCFNRSDQHRGG